MRSWVQGVLEAATPTGRDNVVSMAPSDPHKPPHAWNARYREASEQLAILEAMRAELTAFDVNAEAVANSMRLERVQRVSAINDAQRKLDGYHADIHQMAGNLGMTRQETET